MKIAIYGGTFNPPHLGHLAAARAAFDLLGAERLLLIPTGVPPHKPLPAGSPAPDDRMEMLTLAADQLGLEERVQVSDLELRREGKSYTSDTLRQLKERYPHDELWLLMGTDMFLTLQNWHKPEEILSVAGVVAFGRTEADTEELFAVQRDYLLRRFPGARLMTLTLPRVVDISSSRLRQLLAQGKGSQYLAPAVYGYILRRGLYGTAADLKHLPDAQLRAAALSYLKHKRIPHVLGTEKTAVELATLFGVDVEKARVAALLHDCTKKLGREEQFALCSQYHLMIDPVETASPKLLHAKTGAAVARDVFGVDDEISEAIRWHTTGRAGMTTLEKVIYMADYIEPTRRFPGVEELRRTCLADLDRGLLMGLTMTLEETRSRGNIVHDDTEKAKKWVEAICHEKEQSR